MFLKNNKRIFPIKAAKAPTLYIKKAIGYTPHYSINKYFSIAIEKRNLLLR